MNSISKLFNNLTKEQETYFCQVKQALVRLYIDYFQETTFTTGESTEKFDRPALEITYTHFGL